MLAIVISSCIILIVFTNMDIFPYNPSVDNPYSPISCYPTDEEITKRCLSVFNCSESNDNCVEEDDHIDICSNPDDIMIRESDGCMVFTRDNSTYCGKYSFSIDTNYECK